MSRSNGEDVDDSGAVIVCSHVATDGAPILLARRDHPLQPEDSGWQFVCDKDHDMDSGKVWSIRTIVLHDPSLCALVDEPPGSEFVREWGDQPWRRTS